MRTSVQLRVRIDRASGTTTEDDVRTRGVPGEDTGVTVWLDRRQSDGEEASLAALVEVLGIPGDCVVLGPRAFYLARLAQYALTSSADGLSQGTRRIPARSLGGVPAWGIG
ncbi:hypothetical protein ACFCYH_08205 [Streptomyces sp. NPDC056400]|uniref:hypothetical protein n=1 Tax=Streptomyces sp. NPDC056400 TaxID=3345808 RepID=UPI0035DAC7AC